MNYVKHRARTNVFSAAPCPANVAAAGRRGRHHHERAGARELLWKNTQFMKAGFKSLGFDTGDCQTPVIPVVVGEDLDRLGMATAARGGRFRQPLCPRDPAGPRPAPHELMATHTVAHLTGPSKLSRKSAASSASSACAIPGV